jgi:hypothetical protein
MKTFLQALAIGCIVTFGLFGFAYLAVIMGYIELSYHFYWQGRWLQGFVPCDETVLLFHQTCQMTPRHVQAFYAGLPLGIALYAVPAYLVLLLLKRRHASRR